MTLRESNEPHEQYAAILKHWRCEARTYELWVEVEIARRAIAGDRAVFPMAFEPADFNLGVWLNRWHNMRSDQVPRFPKAHPKFGTACMPECGYTYWNALRLKEAAAEVADVAHANGIDPTPALMLVEELFKGGGIRRLLPTDATLRCVQAVHVLVDRIEMGMAPADDDDWLPIAVAAKRASLTTETVRGWVNRRVHPLLPKTIGGIAHVRLSDVIAERDAKAKANPLRRTVQRRPTSAPKFGSRAAPRSPKR